MNIFDHWCVTSAVRQKHEDSKKDRFIGIAAIIIFGVAIFAIAFVPRLVTI